MDKLLPVIIALLLFTLPIAALPSAQQVEFEFKVFGIGNDTFDGLYYFNNGSFETLDFHKTHRSVKTYYYRGPEEFAVYIENPEFDSSNPQSKEYLPIHTNAYGPISNRMLIIFAAAPDNRTVDSTQRRFKLFNVNDDINHFSRNTIVVVNATGARLFGKVSENKITLPVGVSEPINYDNEKGNHTQIAFALETETGAKLVMSNDVKLSNNRRVLLILEPPRRPSSLRISVRMLSESIFLSEEGILPTQISP